DHGAADDLRGPEHHPTMSPTDSVVTARAQPIPFTSRAVLGPLLFSVRIHRRPTWAVADTCRSADRWRIAHTANRRLAASARCERGGSRNKAPRERLPRDPVPLFLRFGRAFTA